MFFSKQFFVRSYHEILSQGVVLATLPRQSGQPSLISVWKSMIGSLFWIGPRTSKEEKNLERNKLIENLIFIILLSWIVVLRKKISSEHCIRRIICTQMVILICKMSVILSEIPVSVSPYYNPNVSFISLSSFKNYDTQLKNILLKSSQQNCILCMGNTVELSSCCCCCFSTWIGCLLVVLLFLSKELCHTNFNKILIFGSATRLNET